MEFQLYNDKWIDSLVTEVALLSDPFLSGKPDRYIIKETVQNHLDPIVERIQKLEEENTRLREGRFTDSELQNLCHNLDEKDERAFSAGCVEYQKKLFGRCSLLEDYKKIEKKLDFVKHYVKATFNSFKDHPHGTYEQGRARESRDIMRVLEQLDEDFDEKPLEK